MSEFVDPPEPPEARERLNAKNLKGAYLILKPTEVGEWPAKPAEFDETGKEIKRAQGVQPFVTCDVWVFDRAGLVSADTGIRFSWWRAVEQLRKQLGQFVACRPMEQEDKSVVLVALAGEARTAAEKVMTEIGGQPAPVDADPSEAPFDESELI